MQIQSLALIVESVFSELTETNLLHVFVLIAQAQDG